MASTVAPTATTGATATPTVACNLYELPVQDIACGMPFGGNHSDVMSACCGPADVVSFRNDCGLYCLAVDQTVEDLTGCLFQHGAPWGDVFCSGNGTQTAKDPKATAPATASASVVASGAANSNNDDDNNDNNDNNGDSDSESSDAPGAAAGLRPDFAGYKSGLVVGALLFTATAFGAFQI